MTTTQTVPLASLRPSNANPRTRFDEAAIEGLAQSIKTDGVLQNLLVQPGKRGRYGIIAGERRYRALTLLLERGEIAADYPVPVAIRSKLTEEEAHRLAVVENVQREALSAIDEADAIATLLQGGATLDDVSVQTGISVTTIRRRLALAHLCAEAKQAVHEGTLPLGIAEALTLGSEEQQREILTSMEDGA